MLDLLRGFSKGWLAKILIALLVISFAVWGVSGSLIFGGQYNVVQVGRTKIDVNQYRFAYDTQLLTLSQSFGRRLSRQEADALGLRESVLNQVVAGAVLDENGRKMGLGLSDKSVAQEIANDPRFRDLSGQFSRNSLRASLQQAGLTEEDYIANRKQVSMRNQILDGTAASLNMPAAYLDALSVYEGETRVFDYVTLGPEVAEDIPEPTDEELSAYYEANKSDFIAPEFRKIAILKLEPSDVMKLDEVTEEDLQSAYESRKANLRRPERRQVQQLVMPSREIAEAALQKLNSGTTFEDIVEEQGKTIADIDLGVVTRNALPDENIANAAFELELNKPSGIVDGLFGPVLLRVAKIEEETTTPFEEIKDTLREQIALERAVDDVFANFDAIEDERGAGEQLIPTGEKVGLKTRILDAVDARGNDENGNPITDIPQFAELLAEANQALPGDDTQPIEIGDDGFIWFDVLEVIPERQKPEDEVLDDVKTAWTSAETDKRVGAVAQKIAERITAGEDFDAVLADTLPTDSFGQAVKRSTTDPLRRNAQAPNFPIVAVRQGFALSKSAVDTVQIGSNKEIVFKVSDVQQSPSPDVPDNLVSQIDLAASQDILSQVVEHLQSKETVTVNRSAIELAFNPHGGHGGR
ncbi:MAG: SurA N-terminal domain-containing protein [Pseudomonadota bacterium]